MRKLRGGTSPVLLEMLLVILFFALASGVIVRLFTQAYLINRDSARLSLASAALQNECESVRARLLHVGAADGGTLYFDADFLPVTDAGAAVYSMEVEIAPEARDAGTYYALSLTARDAGGEIAALQAGAYVPEAEP